MISLRNMVKELSNAGPLWGEQVASILALMAERLEPEPPKMTLAQALDEYDEVAKWMHDTHPGDSEWGWPESR